MIRKARRMSRRFGIRTNITRAHRRRRNVEGYVEEPHVFFCPSKIMNRRSYHTVYYIFSPGFVNRQVGIQYPGGDGLFYARKYGLDS